MYSLKEGNQVMSYKIEDYFCSNCHLELKAISLISYSCPNCGNILLPKDKKYQDVLEKRIKEIKNEDEAIEYAITKIPALEKTLRNKQFSLVAEIIENMIKLLKDPQTDNKIRVVIAAVIFYIFDSRDIIPDQIPVIGLMDDIAVILIATNMLSLINDAYNVFKVRLKQKAHMNTLVYAIVNDSVGREYNYFEELGKRVWVLKVSEAKKYNLKLIADDLIKSPEEYIDHPYLEKIIVPLNDADKTLFKHNIDEQRNIARMLGAKKIKFSIEDVEISSKQGKAEMKLPFKNDDAIDTSGEFKKINTEMYFDEYEKFDEINLKYIDDLIWYYTNETPFKSIFKERLYNNVKRKELEYDFYTSNLFKSDARTNILKKNKLGINLKFSKSIKRKVKIEIEFFELPQDIVNRRDEIYGSIELALDKRKKELELFKE
jgi:uncharacterized membrane protein YkvA (DUF1232 family)/predicted RNA-binding Zn-ribbon protein involved in translation (DUF1610 family)